MHGELRKPAEGTCHTAFETYSRYCSQKISRSYPNQIEYLMLLVGYVSVQFRMIQVIMSVEQVPHDAFIHLIPNPLYWGNNSSAAWSERAGANTYVFWLCITLRDFVSGNIGCSMRFDDHPCIKFNKTRKAKYHPQVKF